MRAFGQARSGCRAVQGCGTSYADQMVGTKSSDARAASETGLDVVVE